VLRICNVIFLSEMHVFLQLLLFGGFLSLGDFPDEFWLCHGRKVRIKVGSRGVAEATSGAAAILHQDHTCSHPVKTSSSYDHKPRKVNVKRFSLRVSDGTKRFIVLGEMEMDRLGNVNQ